MAGSPHTGEGMETLREALREGTSVLVGLSGVGKSSLIKALLPDRDLRIGDLSARSGLGRHTTTETTLYHLPEGAISSTPRYPCPAPGQHPARGVATRLSGDRPGGQRLPVP